VAGAGDAPSSDHAAAVAIRHAGGSRADARISLLLGAVPGLPRVRFHNPFLDFASGDDFLAPFRLAADGELAPFILVVEGSIPNEANKAEGYWAALDTDPATGQPHDRDELRAG
jgi:hypothetical protein